MKKFPLKILKKKKRKAKETMRHRYNFPPLLLLLSDGSEKGREGKGGSKAANVFSFNLKKVCWIQHVEYVI